MGVVVALTAAPSFADLGPNIDHQPLVSVPAGKAVEIRARIVSNSSGSVFKPCVFVRPGGMAAFTRIEMQPIPGLASFYLATVPAAVVTGSFDYYVEASDTEGNGPTSLGAAEAPLHVQVVADVPPASNPATPPSITTPPSHATVTPLVVRDDTSQSDSGPSAATYGLLGGGAVGGVVGAVLLAVGNSALNGWWVDSNHLSGAQNISSAAISSEHQTANAELTAGGCVLGAGLVAAGVGAYLWTNASSSPAPEKRAERDEAERHRSVASLLVDF